ncbi:hypothetical protein [Chryseosolibacter indicus]|uniref:Uncharacterized protein n=1 Tax=Chryseosolibacter indicus TaxID=2782351 RepID=A0ABS5VKP6_9BACT|nr:hypothetical protein [Chryseosolibacter indicus]MBT1702017.1 hypothetical protein [Chryseosolibacter indicus]
MATLRVKSPIEGFSGSIGKFVIKRVGNRTILAHKPKKTGKQSEKQKQNRLKFKAASAYAKQILKDPQKKAYYLQKAKKLNLTNAYTAVITDYKRKGEIKEINTSKQQGKAEHTIKVKVFKKHFAINKVRVTVCNDCDKPIITNLAMRKGIDEFVFIMPSSVELKPNYKIKATIEDYAWNEVVKEVII